MNKERETLTECQAKGEKLIWLLSKEGDYRIGKIVEEMDESVQLVVEGSKCTVDKGSIHKANPSKFDLVENMAHLSYLNEPSILHNLRQRYLAGLQYTYSGLFLVAINPYKDLSVYTKEFIDRYSSVYKREDAPPHIYAVASEAYYLMRNSQRPQTILITGESGAGKTENTKHAITFLTKISGNLLQSTKLLEERLLSSNPLLEAFGNAQTARNDNSSRFGKFIKIEFGRTGEIIGASIERYLLEASRVTKQTPGERNYHIFYALLQTASAEFLQSLYLSSTQTYRIIPELKSAGVIGADFAQVTAAMDILGLEPAEQNRVFRILAAIIHLSEVVFQEGTSQLQLSTSGEEALSHAAEFLGVDAQILRETLTCPRIRAGNEMVVHGRTAEEANYTLASLCKVIYERLFDWLVFLVNRALKPQSESTSYIGVLDIAGFEILQRNGFEQLCINYTNEKLQQFFNHRMFVLEQEIYLNEGLEWSMIDFGLDLQPTIDLLEASGSGIFSVLDEECIVPGGSDARLLAKISSVWQGSSQFSRPRLNDGFMIEHYAGSVCYSEPGWIAKNKDPLDEAIAGLLLGPDGPVPASAVPSLAATRFRTVAQRHRQQLNNLLHMLRQTNPHFVRCILPNNKKTPGLFEAPRVLHQLRCNGVLEGVRISRQGFPSRVPFHEFISRYALLAPASLSGRFAPSEQGVSLLLSELQVPASLFRLGRTLLFLRQGVLADLEDARNAKILGLVLEVQKRLRQLLLKNREQLDKKRAESLAVLQKNVKIFASVRQWSWWKLCMKIRPLLEVRKAEDELREKEKAIVQQREELLALQAQVQQAELAKLRAEAALASASEEAAAARAASEILSTRLRTEREEAAKEVAAAQKASARAAQATEQLRRDMEVQAKAAHRAREEAASSTALPLLTQIDALKERVLTAETLAQTVQTDLQKQQEELAAALHSQEISERERTFAEDRAKKLATEVEEMQAEVASAESLRRRTESALKAAETEATRSASLLSFEREKYARLEEAFKRATTAPTPAPAPVIGKDNSEDIAALRKELATAQSTIANIQEEYNDLRRQYLALTDDKLGGMLEIQNKYTAEINKMRASSAQLEKKLQRTEQDLASATTSLEQAISAKESEKERRKAAEEALVAKRTLEKDLQRALTRALKEKEDALTELAQANEATAATTEQRASFRQDLTTELAKATSATEAIRAELERVANEVVAVTDTLAIYRAEISRLTDELLRAETEVTQIRSSLDRSRVEMADAKASCKWATDQVAILEAEKAELLRETKAEMSAQRDRFEAAEDAADKDRRERLAELRLLKRELRDKEREAAQAQSARSEVVALQKRLADALSMLDQHAEDKKEWDASVQGLLAQARNEAQKERERAEAHRRELISAQSVARRAETSATRATEKEAEARKAIIRLEEQLLTSAKREKSLSFELRALVLELSAFKELPSDLPEDQPVCANYD
ncbi:myosin heavy chain 9/10/11/14 [Nematocida homosporus]|uniref:myosin heavy chain 9/10/11/14 n=1 Tax=Nematocida homosporus TaxID=1912981 RepID=UPI00221E7E34|nr:myosin heavy chain 9/10/11/14 [Nematocida homosporus]KAI5186632.1 myosin heavy chain 9/10/11/14 [Nematocida homosporus]